MDGAWGTAREFADELWPEFQSEQAQVCVTCLHLTRDDGSMVLALVDDVTYLLSDDGKTVDKLH